MTEQFDVYRNPIRETNNMWPYYIIVQNDCYNDLSRRVIMPMMNNKLVPLWQQAIAPKVNNDFETYQLFAPLLTNIDVRKIAPADYICNLRTARNDVIHAIDSLITNT